MISVGVYIGYARFWSQGIINLFYIPDPDAVIINCE